MHVLITGPRGVGKSTLIRRVLAELKLPVFGFETKKEDGLADAEKGSPIYIYKAGAPHGQTADNLVGYSKNRRLFIIKETFNRFAPYLRSPLPSGHVILMDEIGVMESSSEDFCAAILSILDGDVPVIAAVKDKNTTFLDAVRSHPNCKCFYVSEENRDMLCTQIVAFLTAQPE